jgi:hypothetical protein
MTGVSQPLLSLSFPMMERDTSRTWQRSHPPPEFPLIRVRLALDAPEVRLRRASGTD